MTVILTSSPTGPLDKERTVGLDRKNRFVETLTERWRAGARCLLISASPSQPQFNDQMRDHLAQSLETCALTASVFDIWDDRAEDVSEETLCSYDVVVLGGGHVPTQNAYFRRLDLREKLKRFDGMVIGISAGSMNSAGLVYAMPELPGEATDPAYARFVEGLGLTGVNIIPHYQMIKDTVLDGKRVFEEMAYPDSMGHVFLAIPDGGYLLSEAGVETVYGEAYRIADGSIELFCEENQTRILNG